MRATNTLPNTYQSYRRINLGKNIGLMIGLTVGGLALFAACGWFFWLMATLFRPHALAQYQVLTITPQGGVWLSLQIVWIGAVIGALVLVPLLHEGVHGLCFWYFTRARPRFAYKLIYAYAAAPGWYIPRMPYLIVGLAPVVTLSLLCVVLLAVVPVGWLPFVLAFAVLNAAGSVGDLAISAWLCAQPANLLACDSGNEITLYRPMVSAAHIIATPD